MKWWSCCAAGDTRIPALVQQSWVSPVETGEAGVEVPGNAVRNVCKLSRTVLVILENIEVLMF
jgi:hypothetical protein